MNIRDAPLQGFCLVGLLGSGKTTAGKDFANHGFDIISAGRVVAELVGSPTGQAGRPILQEFGMRLIREGREDDFVAELLSRVRGKDRVVFDGIRIAACVRRLRAELPACEVVFIDCPRDLCRARMCARDGLTADEYEAMVSVPIETDFLVLREEADWIAPNDRDQRSFFRLLDRIIARKR